MQSVTVISCKIPGMIYLNGRFAGECAPDSPYIAPVSPRGALYIEHRPFLRGYAPQAHRVALAGGNLVAESVPEGMFAVQWPGYIAELELAAAPLARVESAFSSLDGVPVAILRGTETVLRVAGNEVALPEGAGLPAARVELGPAVAFTGETPVGKYLACFAAESYQSAGAVVADDIEIEESGRVRALTHLRDTVGHARIEIWEARADALESLDAEYAWADGFPAWPKSAEDAALAALEAAFLGLSAEAEGYLVPRLRGSGLLGRIAEEFDAATRLKYALPEGRHAIGLLKRETDRCARVEPAYYKAVAMGGTQGPWAIEELALKSEEK